MLPISFQDPFSIMMKRQGRRTLPLRDIVEDGIMSGIIGQFIDLGQFEFIQDLFSIGEVNFIRRYQVCRVYGEYGKIDINLVAITT